MLDSLCKERCGQAANNFILQMALRLDRQKMLSTSSALYSLHPLTALVRCMQ